MTEEKRAISTYDDLLVCCVFAECYGNITEAKFVDGEIYICVHKHASVASVSIDLKIGLPKS